MNLSDLHAGQRVMYRVAELPFAEVGTVVRTNDVYAFVLYDGDTAPKATFPALLQPAREFVCAVCHRSCLSNPDFTIEDARAEYEQLHNKPCPPGDPPEGTGQVCDDCYREVVQRGREKGLLS